LEAFIMAHGTARRDPAKESFWRRQVSGHADSRLSVRAFCREHDLKEVAFYWWRRELARRDAEAETPSSSLMPVHVTDSPVRDTDSQIEIVLTDERRVRITGPVNRQTLADVLEVLERRAC
jgi:hypothetical protein